MLTGERRGLPAAVALLAAAAALASAPRTSGQAPQADSVQLCASVKGQTIAGSAIGLPTSGARISDATLVTAAAGSDGEYCKVLGAILPVDPRAPPVLFEVNLPTKWNGKTLQLGGGGMDGSLVTGLRPPPGTAAGAPSALAQGYVTLGSDSGHEAQQPFDDSFVANHEAFENFGGDQIKKTHDVALALILKRYGKAPAHSYFVGGSQGGHEAFIAVQRFPRDYDGVVALYPVYNLAMIELASDHFAKALYAHGGAGWLSPAKIAALQQAVFAACDGLDGAQDGIISDLAACEHAFGMAAMRAKLRCTGGVDRGDECLSDPQIDAVRTIASPFRLSFPLPDGEQSLPGWTILEGAQFLHGLGHSRVPAHPATRADAPKYLIGDSAARYIFTGDLALDSINAFDPANYRAKIAAASRVLDDIDVAIEPFRDRGGKLILLHGTADELNPTFNSVNYYRRLLKHFGQRDIDHFVRFYLVPGFGHGVGVFDARWNPLEAIDAWASRGVAPETLTASDGNPSAHRTRPLCRYPNWPKYDGRGDMDAAVSFRCVAGASK